MVIRRRFVLTFAFLFLVFIGEVFYFDHHWSVLGWLRGEAFYQGRPTSYWRKEIQSWQPRFDCMHLMGPCITEINTYYRETSFFEKRIVLDRQFTWPALFDGDPEGKAVLLELAGESSEHVRTWALEGLDRLKSKRKGPTIIKHYQFDEWLGPP